MDERKVVRAIMGFLILTPERREIYGRSWSDEEIEKGIAGGMRRLRKIGTPSAMRTLAILEQKD